MIQEIVLAFLAIVLVYALMAFMRKPSNMPPGPRPLPILGNLLDVVKRIRNKNMHVELDKIAKIYGKIFTLHLPDQDIVVLNSGTIAHEALLTKRDDFAGRPFLFTFDYLTRGSKDIAAMDLNPTWLIQRKVMFSAIRMYQPKLEDKVNKEVEELSKRLIAYQGKPVNPLLDITLTALNVICAMVFGNLYDIDDPEFHTIFDYNQKMFPLLGALNILNVFPFLIHFPIEDTKTINYVRDTRDRFLNEKYCEHQETYQDGVIRDLTDALIKALQEAEQEDSKTRGLITEDHVIMTLADAFSAGFETTTTSILWFLRLFSIHPDVQEKVQSELDQVVGRDALPQWEDRGRLPYLVAAIEETFRLTAVGPFLVPHKALKDSTLEGYHIPKGTTILVNAWTIQHDEKEWKNPYVFDPDRFLDDEGKVVQVAGIKSFLPFGAGRRVCVGETFARQELFIVVSRLLHEFKVQPAVTDCPTTMDGDLLGSIHYPKPFEICFNQRS